MEIKLTFGYTIHENVVFVTPEKIEGVRVSELDRDELETIPTMFTLTEATETNLYGIDGECKEDEKYKIFRTSNADDFMTFVKKLIFPMMVIDSRKGKNIMEITVKNDEKSSV